MNLDLWGIPLAVWLVIITQVAKQTNFPGIPKHTRWFVIGLTILLTIPALIIQGNISDPQIVAETVGTQAILAFGVYELVLKLIWPGLKGLYYRLFTNRK